MNIRGIKILILSLCISTIGFAQKPSGGDWLTEAYLNLNGVSSNFTTTGLRGRYFFSPTSALRVDLGVMNLKEDGEVSENPDGTGATGTSVDKLSANGIGVGLEKHFAGSLRFSPFVGASVGFALVSSSGEHTNTDGDIYIADYAETSSNKGSTFGISLFTGADYWINQSFYLGGEFGLNFNNSSMKDGEMSFTTGGTTTETVEPGGKSTSYGETVVASIRIGYNLTGGGGLFSKKDAEKKDSDNDGVADVDDKCPNTPSGVSVNASGCPSFGDEIQLLAKNIYFEIDSDVIKSESFNSLNKIVAILDMNKMAKVSIEGHTDNTASHDYNVDLSERRAKSVLKYLKEKGVSADRLVAKGYGETQPVSSNDTDAGRALNRRVELNIFY